jgi:ParB family chromosome partitioning protein
LINTGPPAAAPVNPEAPADGRPPRLPMDRIDPSPWQPRRRFDEEALSELADSIREQGLIQPLVVREKGGRYELIAGERRFRALQRLEWRDAPAVILDAADTRMLELALVENLQRDDLNPIETAEAYQALLANGKYANHEALASRLGVARASLTNTLRLLGLPGEVRQRVAERALSIGHAKAILALPDAVAQMRMARRAVAEGLSVRRVEELCAPREARKPVRPQPSAKDVHVRDWEDRLRRRLGAKVSIQDRGGAGTMVIEYHTPADIVRLAELMGVEDGD